MSRVYFIVEGETEEFLVKKLFLGKVVVLNLWTLKNNKINSLLRVIPPKSSKVFIVCDTDCISNISRGDFITNFHSLKKHVGSKNIVLFQQNRNLEDELIKCLGINKRQLYSLFNRASGNQQLKSNFLQEKSLVKKLMDNGFQQQKLWDSNLCKELKELEEFHSFPTKYSKLILRDLSK